VCSLTQTFLCRLYNRTGNTVPPYGISQVGSLGWNLAQCHYLCSEPLEVDSDTDRGWRLSGAGGRQPASADQQTALYSLQSTEAAQCRTFHVGGPSALGVSRGQGERGWQVIL
jgi:hypothetical protein